MIEIINGKAYVKKGDKVYEVGGGSNIITADSVEQLPDPASVPEGTIALVPSEGESGGLPVIEIGTVLSTEQVALTQEESAKLTEQMGKPAFIQFTADLGGVEQTVAGCFFYSNNQYFMQFMTMMFTFMTSDGAQWYGAAMME